MPRRLRYSKAKVAQSWSAVKRAFCWAAVYASQKRAEAALSPSLAWTTDKASWLEPATDWAGWLAPVSD